MNENEENELLRRLVVADLTVSGLLIFLKQHGLEDEGKEFAEKFLASVSRKDWEDLITNAKVSVKER